MQRVYRLVDHAWAWLWAAPQQAGLSPRCRADSAGQMP